MKQKNFIALIGVWTCAIGLMLIAFPSHSVNAEQPPSEGCVAVSKQEYDSADRQKLLHTRLHICENGPVRAALLLVLPLIIHLETLAKAVRIKETAR